MGWIKTNLEGVAIFEPKVWGDERGYFMETYNTKNFHDFPTIPNFVQDNEAFSSRGILRGLHYQTGINAQSKLVRVISGEVLDVVVDIRPDSPTYGRHLSVILNDITKKQMFVPKGFAHGYVVLSQEALFAYKVDGFYDPASEGCVRYNSENLKIDWILKENEIQVSPKDADAPVFGSHKSFQ